MSHAIPFRQVGMRTNYLRPTDRLRMDYIDRVPWSSIRTRVRGDYGRALKWNSRLKNTRQARGRGGEFLAQVRKLIRHDETKKRRLDTEPLHGYIGYVLELNERYVAENRRLSSRAYHWRYRYCIVLDTLILTEELNTGKIFTIVFAIR